MATIDLEIDLDDGLPPMKREVTERKRISETKPLRFVAPEKIVVTSEPVAVVISYAQVSCLGCGAEHKDHRGIFIEHKLSNKAKALRRVSLKDLGPYMKLPRRVDMAPREAIPICSECFMVERLFQEAALVAQMQSDLFDIDVGQPRVVENLARQLEAAHSIQLEEEL
jgi:hypothetical protein